MKGGQRQRPGHRRTVHDHTSGNYHVTEKLGKDGIIEVFHYSITKSEKGDTIVSDISCDPIG